VHPKVVGTKGWALVRSLVRAGLTKGWTLAGGTGLALQLGHRLSYDLDFFATRNFDGVRLTDALATVAAVSVLGRSAGTLHVTLAGLRVSFLKLQRPLLFPGTDYRGIVVADPRDIAVMKVLAIGGRGSRKDFVDLHFFIRGGGSLESVFGLIRRRFRGIDFNEYHLLRSLVYFDDAESEPMPRMLSRASWAEIKRAIVAEVRRLSEA
jgi:hypothetical protein